MFDFLFWTIYFIGILVLIANFGTLAWACTVHAAMDSDSTLSQFELKRINIGTHVNCQESTPRIFFQGKKSVIIHFSMFILFFFLLVLVYYQYWLYIVCNLYFLNQRTSMWDSPSAQGYGSKRWSQRAGVFQQFSVTAMLVPKPMN